MASVIVPNPPVPGERIVDGSGNMTRPWRRFLELLRLRTGGNNDNVNTAAPVGSGQEFYGSTAPSGWVLCDGSAISRTVFSELFGVIGVTYGVGDGSTTFNVPDARGRTLIGAGLGSGLTNRVLASTGGEEDVSLTVANLPGHNHGVTDSGHLHAVTDPGHLHVVTDPGHAHAVTDPGHGHGVTDPGHTHGESSGNFVNDAAGTEYDNTNGDKGTTNANTASSTTGLTVDSNTTGLTVDSATTSLTVDSAITSVTVDSAVTGISTTDTGSTTAHNNMQPFLVVNFIIRTGVSV